jgi:hypothetical protein
MDPQGDGSVALRHLSRRHAQGEAGKAGDAGLEAVGGWTPFKPPCRRGGKPVGAVF